MCLFVCICECVCMYMHGLCIDVGMCMLMFTTVRGAYMRSCVYVYVQRRVACVQESCVLMYVCVEVCLKIFTHTCMHHMYMMCICVHVNVHVCM